METIESSLFPIALYFYETVLYDHGGRCVKFLPGIYLGEKGPESIFLKQDLWDVENSIFPKISLVVIRIKSAVKYSLFGVHIFYPIYCCTILLDINVSWYNELIWII